MDKEQAIAARLARVAEIEAEIDPGPRRRGRVIADLITVAIVTPFMLAFDLHISHPFVMLGLMAAALAVNHAVPRITQRRLRRERTDLLAQVESSDPDGEQV